MLIGGMNEIQQMPTTITHRKKRRRPRDTLDLNLKHIRQHEF